ncbi:MAG: hypothetical protein JW936_07810 [Sedimentisphaerales bacterium]|nr:hypothetical protein [Sedimentisphaerales bacterium]
MAPMQPEPDLSSKAFRDHSRHFRGSQWIYPVLSRRSKGISVGVNLSPEKICNFNCIYCQVDRCDGDKGSAGQQAQEAFCLETVATELRHTLELAQSGELFDYEPFTDTPRDLRRLNDIALSGDGEPTASVHFAEVCSLCVRIKQELKLDTLKIIVITNASLLDKEPVKEALRLLKAHGGQVWAKLDAGTADYYRQVNQSAVPFARIVSNITETAKFMPVVIQTLFMRIDGKRPAADEIAGYAERLKEISGGGGNILNVQLHTIARQPRQANVTALSNAELDEIAEEISAISALPICKFYGCGNY